MPWKGINKPPAELVVLTLENSTGNEKQGVFSQEQRPESSESYVAEEQSQYPYGERNENR